MNPKKPQTELRKAIGDLKPQFKQAAWFSLFASLLILAPSGRVTSRIVCLPPLDSPLIMS